MDYFSMALDARAHWALHRVSVVAGDDTRAAKELRWAVEGAKRIGNAAAWDIEATPCPALLGDVEPLRTAFTQAFDVVHVRRRALRTHEGIEAELNAFAKEATRRCGSVYELFARWFSEDVDDLLEELDAPFQGIALELAKGKGYMSAEEREAMQEENEANGDCPLTGIDTWCCPCGRHE